MVEDLAAMLPMTRSQWAFIRGAGGALDHLQFLRLEGRIERVPVLGVAIAQQEPQGLHAYAEAGGEVSPVVRNSRQVGLE
ncbi:hypothetical protein SAZ11_47045 [Streptomyces sp. FXJ1.4098]|nr:hypothetical protein [Streptomyces sp. FXJ1.4098]